MKLKNEVDLSEIDKLRFEVAEQEIEIEQLKKEISESSWFK